MISRLHISTKCGQGADRGRGREEDPQIRKILLTSFKNGPLSHFYRKRTVDIFVAHLSICSAQKLVDSSCTECTGANMKNQILIPVILGLHNSIFTVDAKQACPAIKNVTNRIEFQFRDPQHSTDPRFTNLKGGLQLRNETKQKGNRVLRIQTLLFL